MSNDYVFTPMQKAKVIDLLWHDLRHPARCPELRQTGNGNKTQTGLIAAIEDIVQGGPSWIAQDFIPDMSGGNADLKLFTDACIEALYFTETGGDSEAPEDAELDPKCRLDLEADCRSFWRRYGPFILAEGEGSDKDGPGVEQAGHDFWYTRNGHGAGFWDGDWPTYGTLLTNGSKNYGEFSPDFIEEAKP